MFRRPTPFPTLKNGISFWSLNSSSPPGLGGWLGTEGKTPSYRRQRRRPPQLTHITRSDSGVLVTGTPSIYGRLLIVLRYIQEACGWFYSSHCPILCPRMSQ